MDSRFLSLFLLCLVALLIPLLTDKLGFLKVPEVVAEMVAGIIIGKSGLNLVVPSAPIELIALLGFCLLMFLSGMEADFRNILTKHGNNGMKRYPNPLRLSVVLFLITFVISYMLSCLLIWPQLHIDPLLTAAIFSSTSLGIVLPLMKEKNMTRTPLGQNILILSILADFTTMMMIPLVMSRIADNRDQSSITALLILPVMFIGILSIWRRAKGFFKRKPSYSTYQIDIRAALALMLLFVSLADLINTEAVIGAFLAGILFAWLFPNSRTYLVHRLDTIGYGFFIPVFFINIGVSLNLHAAFQARILPVIILFLLIGFAVKIAPSLLLRRWFSWREAIASGVLLSSNLSLTIAISFVAWNTGLISETIHFAFLLFAVLTSILSPLLFTKMVS